MIYSDPKLLKDRLQCQKKRYTKKQIMNIASDVLRGYGDNQYPVKVIKLVKNIGLKVFKVTFNREDVSGMLEAKKGIIYVSENDRFSRQRFSIAHELGHYVLHYKGKTFEEKDNEHHVSFRDSLSSLGFSVKEMEANFFAVNLLMPQDKVKELNDAGYDISYMTDFFGVSYTAMVHRLDFLGYD